jgi:hypothetical protein
MSIDAMKQALEYLDSPSSKLWPAGTQYKIITALRLAIEQAEKQEAWKTSDMAYRPEGLPQDFVKHEVDKPDDWSEWVCPDPTQYFMKCCDCGLVHEMQFNIVKYSEGDECKPFNDPNVQVVFRARRHEVAEKQEPVAWMYEDDYQRMLTSETFCKVWSVEVGSATRGETTVPLYTPPAAQPAPVQEPRHIVQSNGRHSHLLTHMMNSRTTPPAAQPEQKQDSTCNKTLRAEGKGYPRTCRKCGKGPCIADRVQPEQKQWDAIPDAFNDWWDADYDDTGNPYRKDSPAYWAWSGWSAANKEKNT